MKKRLLVSALVLSSLTISAAYAQDVDVPEIINKTYDGYTSSDSGGAISNSIDSVIKGSTFSNNSASGNGGAIYTSGDMLISGSEFKDNTGTYGGAVINLSKLTVENSSFTENTADTGGAIFSQDELIVNNSTFTGNTADNIGGAIYNYGNLEINGADFSQNKAEWEGGAIYNWGEAYITGASFNDNSSNSCGGAIYNYDILTVENSSFSGNSAESGGAIYNNNELTVGENISFTGNTATVHGGAIYNEVDAIATVKDNAVFTDNHSEKYGGAIYNSGDLTIGANAQFTDNSGFVGGAIYHNADEAITIGDGAKFVSNTAVQGGAIFLHSDTELTLNNASFIGNTATNHAAAAGGAIFISSVVDTAPVTITNSLFDSNTSDVAGGAIQQADGSATTITVENSTFTNNSTGAEGGAITSDSTLIVKNSVFNGNTTTATERSDGGGAIMLYDQSNTTITGSTFVNNSAGTAGGAIGTRTNASSDKSSLTVEDSLFSGNTAGIKGGAISATIDASVTDSSFVNNTAAEQGGAIWANGNLEVNAVNSDVVFSGNSASEGGDIYMATAGKDLTMNIADGKTLTSTAGISGDSGKYNFNVSGGGTLDLSSYLKNADMVVNDSTLTLRTGDSQVNGNNNTIVVNNGGFNILNNSVDKFDDNLITLNGSVNISADIDLGNGEGDYLTNLITDATTVNITEINPIANTTGDYITVDVKEALGLQNAAAVVINPDEVIVRDTLSPIRYLTGSIDENGILSYGPRGNGYKDFNPAIMVAPVAAQLGGYLSQLNSYDQAFMNLDMKMLMTQEERNAMRMRNSYAAAGGTYPMVFSPTYLPEKEAAGWVRPYATFESVRLQGGPRVSNVMYGSFFGVDSDMYEFKNGAMAQFSVYAGYNGSHQAFSGNSLYQNGGNLGVTGIVYKGNFFSALTANAGASVVDASTMYGSEDFPMLMAGVASKTGYNWELAKGKFIIQPNYLMSYTFVNTFDYTNAAGVRVQSDPLNAIQIAPGLKFIGNLKNGWQPYVNLRMVWNIMDKTDFTAAQTSLPDLSVKPYFEYGLGVQKRWGERFTGFGQCMLRNGGRNGVSLGFGFRWALGKSSSSAGVMHDRTVIKQPANIQLSNIK